MSVASNPSSTLQQIAKAHAKSTRLTDSTRLVFSALAEHGTLGNLDSAFAEQFEAAFFEAALTSATRGSYSSDRRAMAENLARLRKAVVMGDDIRPQEYTLRVTVHGDADLIRRALLDLDEPTARVVYVSNPVGIARKA